MIGYKVFNSDWKCRDMQYAVGETYSMDDSPVLCEKGFHFCEYPWQCFDYYPMTPDKKYALIEAIGEISYSYSKCVTNKIKILLEISYEEFSYLCREILKSNNALVTIPYGVTSISDRAFAYCGNLTSVSIPDSVTSIDDYAFLGCSNLVSVKIGNGVTSIGWHTFHDCSSLASVMIPDSVTSIGGRAFAGCKNLTVCCFAGSEAQKYCKANKIAYKTVYTSQNL